MKPFCFKAFNEQYFLDLETGFCCPASGEIREILNLRSTEYSCILDYSRDYDETLLTDIIASLLGPSTGKMFAGAGNKYRVWLDEQTIHTGGLRKWEYGYMNLTSGMDILDVGCGTGAMTTELMELMNRKGTAVGLDINAELLREAEKKVLSVDNRFVSFKWGDANDIPYTDNCFDLTICRYLLQHIKDPINVVKEMKRVAKPGGRIVCIDADDAFIAYPELNPALRRLNEAYGRNQVCNGGDRTVGRKLYSIFQSLGFSAFQVYPFSLGRLSGNANVEAMVRDISLFILKHKYVENQLYQRDLVSAHEFLEGLNSGIEYYGGNCFYLALELMAIGVKKS